jgi:hypothetical protein
MEEDASCRVGIYYGIIRDEVCDADCCFDVSIHIKGQVTTLPVACVCDVLT